MHYLNYSQLRQYTTMNEHKLSIQERIEELRKNQATNITKLLPKPNPKKSLRNYIAVLDNSFRKSPSVNVGKTMKNINNKKTPLNISSPILITPQKKEEFPFPPPPPLVESLDEIQYEYLYEPPPPPASFIVEQKNLPATTYDNPPPIPPRKHNF